jgi:hypothetical protein
MARTNSACTGTRSWAYPWQSNESRVPSSQTPLRTRLLIATNQPRQIYHQSPLFAQILRSNERRCAKIVPRFCSSWSELQEYENTWSLATDSRAGTDCQSRPKCSSNNASADRASRLPSHASGAFPSNTSCLRVSVRCLQVPPAKHTSHAHGKNKMRVSRTVLVGANLRRHLDSSLRTARRIAADC